MVYTDYSSVQNLILAYPERFSFSGILLRSPSTVYLGARNNPYACNGYSIEGDRKALLPDLSY